MDINMTNNDYYEFETTNPYLKGLVVISHGMAEHIGRYSWLIEKLNADGYSVIANSPGVIPCNIFFPLPL